MSRAHFIRPLPILLCCFVVCFVSCRAPENQTRSKAGFTSTAPTGVYASTTPVGGFTLRLETGGGYQVLAESPSGASTLSEKGRWAWNDAAHEFLLTPNPTSAGGFNFEFRRLRVDLKDPDTLQRIPLHGAGAVGGTIDYVRLKRSGD